MMPSMAYAPQPTNGQMDQPNAQIQLMVMMETARSDWLINNFVIILFQKFPITETY